MSDQPELPSTRQILEKDAAGSKVRTEPGSENSVPPMDEDFRRVMMALRAVLQMRGF